MKTIAKALMKKQILAGWFSLAAVVTGFGQSDSYVNDITFVSPPQPVPIIQATNFINDAIFGIDLTSIDPASSDPFGMQYTVNYTNYGILASVTGFRFDTYRNGLYYQAGNFYNSPGSLINCGGQAGGGPFAGESFFFSSGTGPYCEVWATNIVNKDLIEMGVNGQLTLQGQNIDLSGGQIQMEGFEAGNSGNFVNGLEGLFDGYWNVGQSTFIPADYFSSFPSSPENWVTNRDYSTMQNSISIGSFNGGFTFGQATAGIYTNQVMLGVSNQLIQVVFFQNGYVGFTNNVYFTPDNGINLEYLWQWTNVLTGLPVQDALYITDELQSSKTLSLLQDGTGPYSTGLRPTYMPTNYYFSRGVQEFLGTPATPTSLPPAFNATKITADFSTYQAMFEPTTALPGDLAHRSYSTLPGRIEIVAGKTLNLASSRIGALNYLRVSATNGFTSDSLTRILTPAADFDLAANNGLLVISNLMPVTCPRLDGTVSLYSARWIYVDPTGLTNNYQVWLVDSEVAPSAATVVQSVELTAANVILSDVLNVYSNLLINATSLTLTTNGPGAQAPAGQINFLTNTLTMAGAFPNLQNLTNFGAISTPSTATFGSAAAPYNSFINHGSVSGQGCNFYATNFVNTGLIDAGASSIRIQAGSAILTNGVLNASSDRAGITLSADTLFINNTMLNANQALNFSATTSFTDGGTASSNVWTTGAGGFNLASLPPTASLLGTTIIDTVSNSVWAYSQWCGRDLGPVPSGFNNDAALGQLILDGSAGSLFFLQGSGGSNTALYVDRLELQDSAATRDGNGNLSELQFNGLKLYYAQALLNGVQAAEMLNHKNGGALNWVPYYAGAFSSTNVVYPDGTTNLLNQALVTSRDIVSGLGGGPYTPNYLNPTPVLVSSQMHFAVSRTNQPVPAAVLSWQTFGTSTNIVFYRNGLTNSWQVLTNFTAAVDGAVSITDPFSPTNRFYLLQVGAKLP
jgi:hypothetical protein